MAQEFITKYDIASEAAGSILGQVPYAALATGVDVITTLWNSLPLTPNIRTEDVLSSIDKDALAVYEQHPDTIQTLSLIGGAIAPGGLGIKLLGRARAGVTSLGWTENFIGGSFTGARQASISAQITDLFKEAGTATAAHRKHVRDLTLSNITKEVIDNAAIELAVVAGINAHPYMEDYWKDPVENFAIGTMIGSGLGLFFAIPGSRRAVLEAIGKPATQATETVAREYIQVDPSFTAAAKFQAQTENIRKLTRLVADEDQWPIVRQMADSVRQQEEALRENILQEAAPFLYTTAENGKKVARSDELKQAVIDLLNDNKFIGVDKIRVYDMDTAVNKTSKNINIFTQKQGLAQTIAQHLGLDKTENILNTFVTPDGKAAMVFTRLSTGEIFAKEGAKNVGLAVDSAKALEATKLHGRYPEAKLHVPRNDFSEDNLMRSISSARSDAEFLEELRLGDKKLGGTIAPDHLPRMNGQLVAAAALPDDARNALKWHLRSDLPTYAKEQAFVSTVSGVGKDYQVRAENIAKTQSLTEDPNLSESAKTLLSGWIGGTLAGLREGMQSFQRTGGSTFKAIAAEIWNAGAKTRQEFRKIADSEGYVYLYRATTKNVTGHSAVESYAIHPPKLREFGTARLFRVHTDNIIGVLWDTPHRTHNLTEVLVTPPHNQIVNNIPVQTADNTAVKVATGTSSTEVGFDELALIYARETQRQVQDMIANKNFSVEEISARLNIKPDGVRRIMSHGNLEDTMQVAGFDWRRYSDADKIDSEYLHPRNKLYMAVGNPVKNQHAESMANLDARGQKVMHTEQVAQQALLSRSEIGIANLGIFDNDAVRRSLDFLEDNIGQINNVLVGNPIFQSADNALRKLKDSPIITFIGQEIVRKRDAFVKVMLEPLASSFLPIKNNPVHRAEFNAVVNKLYGLSGWRDIEKLEDGTARLVQRDHKGELVPVLDKDGNEFIIRQHAVVDALEAARPVSAEILKLHNLNRAITGQGPLNDLGYYLPPLNLIGKNHAYVIDTSGLQGTRLLVANTGPELEDAILAFTKANSGQMTHLNIVRKGDQEAYNLAKGYTDYEAQTTYANVAFQHKGSSELAILPSDTRLLENTMSSYENLVTQGMRKFSETYLYDTMGWLDRMSSYHQQAVAAQPKGIALRERAPDAAMTVKNILLGRDQLEQSPKLKQINTLVDTLLNGAYSVANNITRSTVNKLNTREYYDELLTGLAKAGVTPMWKSFDEYLATTRSEAKNIAPALVSAGNGLLATTMLRVFETGQAAVNVMSLPILTWSALMERLPSTPVNADGGGIKFPLRAMYAGMRSMWDPVATDVEKRLWDPRGITDQTVRQYTEVVGALKGASQGGTYLDRAIQAATDMQNHWFTELVSKPADWAEKFTRRYAMHTGYWSAKQAYPGLDELGATIAASAFTDRVIGNYYAAQRPTAFQGTFGASLGLFQTYFLTFAQHTYRGLEERNFAQLATLAASQAGIFGISSWPGFNLLSEQVVSRFNDNHYDLTTGTFRAADKNVAEMILYGLPSSLGPAFYTRGDISPRVPGAIQELAVLNGIKEGWNAMYQIATKTAQGVGDGTPMQSLFEALSLQSLNRPIARWSELVTGHSVTRQGNTVSPQNEVWTPIGVASRAFSVRPLEEQVARNARHLNSFYGQVDFENRQSAVQKLKTAVRDGNVNDTLIGTVAEEYLRFGGSAKGWNSAINEVLATSNEGTRATLLRKLQPDSPIRKMIDDLY